MAQRPARSAPLTSTDPIGPHLPVGTHVIVTPNKHGHDGFSGEYTVAGHMTPDYKLVRGHVAQETAEQCGEYPWVDVYMHWSRVEEA
jgi:hypothetical protein